MNSKVASFTILKNNEFMKIQLLKFVMLITLMTAGGFACSKDDNPDDDLVSIQIKDWKDEVDPYIVSFALPGIVDARCYNGGEGILPYLSYDGFPGALNPNDWMINLVLAKETNRKKLAPIITLAPGAKITWIHQYTGIGENVVSKKVDYTGIAKIGVYDFTKWVYLDLITPDGSKVTYKFIAHAHPNRLLRLPVYSDRPER